MSTATDKPERQVIRGTFHDAATGQTITRELTADEIAALLQTDETPPPASE